MNKWYSRETLSCTEMLHTLSEIPAGISSHTSLHAMLSGRYSEFYNILVLINNRASATPLCNAECYGHLRMMQKRPEASRGANNLDTQGLAFQRTLPPFPFHM